MQKKQTIGIVGAGFAGIQTAHQLINKFGKKNVVITLISDRDHFEYYPGLHSYLSIKGPLPYIQIPLKDIFKNKPVNVVHGRVVGSDLTQKQLTLESGETFSFDYVVLAVGSESTFFNIQGLQAMAFPFQNVDDAVGLRRHVETLFEKHCIGHDITDCVIGLHFVVVGAGPNGVDLAGELASFTKFLCKKHNLKESLVTINLIEGASGVLPMMPENVQKIVTKRLRTLGVNVLCNRQLLKQGSWTIGLADMTLGAKTLIWTAGTITNELVTKIPGLVLEKKNKVTVTNELEIEGFPNCFAIGDASNTQYSGLAQTAIHDGNYIATVISNRISGKKSRPYAPQSVAYNIGVGHGWSITKVGSLVISGRLSSWLRKIIDLKYFLSILPLSQVLYLSPFKKRK